MSEYRVQATSAATSALLAADDAAWGRAGATNWGASPWTTTFRALWGPEALCLRFDIADREPWHTMTSRDDRIWNEEVVEIFLDPSGSGVGYAELEINPANVVCDLVVYKPWPEVHSDPSWDIEGLETAVRPWRGAEAGPDGWSATAVLPWKAFRSLPSKASSLPPRANDRWRFNIYRIKRPHGPKRPEHEVAYNAWAPTGSPSFHVPSRFGDFVFV